MAKKPVKQGDHSVAERIAAQCANMKQFVVWWHYSANYSTPVIEMADTPEDAFNKAYPSLESVRNPDLHKFAVEIANCSKANELRNPNNGVQTKPVTIGSREYFEAYSS